MSRDDSALFAVSVDRGGHFHWFAKRAIEDGEPPEKDSGHDLMRRALSFDVGAAVVVIDTAGTVLGVSRWRDTERGTQRCLTGVATVWQCHGVGTLLVRSICRVRPNRPMWCKSLPHGWRWCDSLGMHCVETLPDGRRVYEWSAEEVRAFADA